MSRVAHEADKRRKTRTGRRGRARWATAAARERLAEPLATARGSSQPCGAVPVVVAGRQLHVKPGPRVPGGLSGCAALFSEARAEQETHLEREGGAPGSEPGARRPERVPGHLCSQRRRLTLGHLGSKSRGSAGRQGAPARGSTRVVAAVCPSARRVASPELEQGAGLGHRHHTPGSPEAPGPWA